MVLDLQYYLLKELSDLKKSLLFFVAIVIGFPSNLSDQNTSLKDTNRLGNHLFIFISSSSELLFHYVKVVSQLDVNGFSFVSILICPPP